MASFTDNPNGPQFTPYIQQLPVEAMVNVGTQKQAQYDQGYQKIQANIDQIAGMDVVRDVDKAYLQSKLNTLQGDLRGVAAGDFSNYQLVNSVGGMVTKIGKDKNIQNAVGSTANYRAQAAKLQKDVEEGKSNPANTDYFQKHANAWLNSTNVNDKYTGQYIPNFDVFKFAKETFDAVKPDGYSFDQLYITDANGVPKTDRLGRPIASPMMKRLEKEGVFPDKVRQTLNQIFADPRVDQQLSISGEYALKQRSPEMLSGMIIAQKDQLVGDLTEQMNLLNLQKNTGKNVQNEIDQIKLAIENTKSKYDDYSKAALNNPDAVRAIMYKDEVRNNYTSMFSWTKSKEQTLDSPLWNANFKLSQEANRVAEFNQKMALDKEKFNFDKQAKGVELNLKAKELSLKGGPNGSVDAKQEFMPTDDLQYLDVFEKSYENSAENYKQTSNAFVYTMVLKTPENDAKLEALVRAGNTKEASLDILMKKNIRDKYTNQGITPDEETVNKEFAEQKSKWEIEAITAINKMTPADKEKNPDVSDSYNSYTKAKKEFTKDSEVQKEAELRAKARIGEDNSKVLDVASYKIAPVKVNIDGKSIDVSAKNMHDAVIYSKYLTGGIFQDEGIKKKAQESKDRLISEGKGDVIEYVENNVRELMMYNPKAKAPTGRFDEPQEAFHNPAFIKEFSKLFKNVDSEAFNIALKAKSDVIKEMGYTVSPKLRSDLLTGNVEEDRNLSTKVLNTAGNYSTNSQNLSPDFDYAKIEEIINSKATAKPFELKIRKDDVSGEVQSEIVFYGADGKRAAGMVITEEEANSFGKDLSGIYESQETKIIRNRMNASPLGSTSIGNPKDISTYVSGDAYFEKSDFPNLNKTNFDVKANLIKQNGLIYPVVYVTDGITTPEPRVLPGQPDVGQAVDKLKSMTPSFINSLLNEK